MLGLTWFTALSNNLDNALLKKVEMFVCLASMKQGAQLCLTEVCLDSASFAVIRGHCRYVKLSTFQIGNNGEPN